MPDREVELADPAKLEMRPQSNLLLDARASRALALLDRGRQAAAKRWFRAAIESARRRHDEIGQARAACQLVELLAERWSAKRGATPVFQGVPALLQIVHDAEDELAALQGGCSWIRRQTGGDAAGLVTIGPARELVAADGLTSRDLNREPIRDALASSGGLTVTRGLTTVVSAPVLAHGTPIGLAVVQGQAEIVTALGEGATLLASLCVPAMRGRLEALAFVRSGDRLAAELLGRSPSIVGVRDAIARAATTTFPVLFEGESGTGKELAARALHRLSGRGGRRLSAVNCAAFTDELAEAELFGYVRGAFTGAILTRTGLFEEASGGTLLLDEVSELSGRAQAKLLRVLQEREVRRIGENTPRPVDVRIVAATNRPLADEVTGGRFREDLMFRLAVVRIRLPPLRERIEDLAMLAQTHWPRVLAEVGKQAVLGHDALAALSQHSWPGNVRELQNVLAGLALAAPARGRVTASQVAQLIGVREVSMLPPARSLAVARRHFERQVVSGALARHVGSRSAAAVELGLTRQGLAKAMRRLGVGAGGDGTSAA